MSKLHVVALLLLALWISGCAGQRRAPANTATPPAATATPLPAKSTATSVPLLSQLSIILNQVANEPNNAIPVLVLNNAKCLTLIPASAGGPVMRGAVTCRVGSTWSMPSLVSFSASNPARNVDLLLFLMTQGPVSALLGGTLDLASNTGTSPGPILRDTPNITNIDLTGKDILIYTRTGRVLSGTPLKAGTLRLDVASTTKLYGRKISHNSLLTDNGPSSGPVGVYQNAVNSFFNTITPVGIIIHHSVFIPSSQTAEGDVDHFHDGKGFLISCFGRTYHIAYHYLILPDGTVKAGRPERCEGAHTRGYNSYLGIALVGDFSSQDNRSGKIKPATPTTRQMQSLVQLCQRLRDTYHIPIQRILRHSDVGRTKCPGDRLPFAEFVAQLREEPRPSTR